MKREMACLQTQQQQHQLPLRPPVQAQQLQPDGQTPEKAVAREFIQQWSRGMQPAPNAHNDTQSTMTG